MSPESRNKYLLYLGNRAALCLPFPIYPLVSVQDAVDVLALLALIPIYWLLFKGVTRGTTGLAVEIPFLKSGEC